MSDKTLKIALFDFHGLEVVHSDSDEWVQKEQIEPVARRLAVGLDHRQSLFRR